jgi:peptidoglycan/xylan/chitin deacetylase (PgdA/CDA1 family)
MSSISLRPIARRVRSAVRSLAGHALILLYHRVTELSSDPQWLCITPSQFAEQLEVLRRYYYPLHLTELRRRLQKGNVPRKAVVITFDDGYADNLYQAKPLLERFDIPATVFVTTGKIEKQNEFWWEELERYLLQTEALPESLSLTVSGKVYSWVLTGEREHVLHGGGRWNVTMDSCPTPRHQIYRELAPVLRSLSNEAQEAILQDLAEWANVPRRVRDTHRTMRANEIVQLNADGLVEIGAHTVTHPVLSLQSLEIQRWEIENSKEKLETILDRPVTTFAYPFGTRGDYNSETVMAVQRAGFSCACSNFPGWVVPGVSPYELPRYLVRDWGGNDFSRQLAEWHRG